MNELTPLQTLVNQFLPTDDKLLFDEIRSAHLLDGFLYATDGHAMIRVPASRLDFAHTNRCDFPKIRKPWEDTEPNNSLKIDVSTLATALSRIELVPETLYEQCSTCEGDGEVYAMCDCCGNETTKTCKDCSGDGEIEKKGDKLVPDYEAYLFVLNGVKFWSKYFAPLLDACKLEGATTVELTRTAERYANVLKIGELEFLIMPNMAEDMKEIPLTPQLPLL